MRADGQSITVAITGASGALYAQRLLQLLDQSPQVRQINLVISDSGRQVIAEELGIEIPQVFGGEIADLLDLSHAGSRSEELAPEERNVYSPHDQHGSSSARSDMSPLTGLETDPRRDRYKHAVPSGTFQTTSKLICFRLDDIGAALASGSYPVNAMVVIPCSVGTLGAIASGATTNLIHRAADVTLKEDRPLILVVRETPLNAIHLENMLKLRRMGVVIMPATPAFYHQPKTIDDLVNHFVYRVLDHLKIEHSMETVWQGGMYS